jgi:hypothetical protein
MLVRVRGGTEGVALYLKEGQKSGREYSRDEMDERVILAGDLEVTDRIIALVGGKGERYKHITLGFKEDEISFDTLAAIVEEFRIFMFAAYHPDEYNFYAEAHLPKIKSYEHSETGALIERKPHIHIVVPKINLLTNNTVDPFGWFNLSKKHLSAWQHYINNKYGLADPQANRRVKFTDASEMISRYKGDTFTGANRELRGRVLDTLMARAVTSYEEFSSLLVEFGTVRHRNAGKPSMYANIVPPGEKKGVNLKDYVFSPAFLALAIEDKRRYLERENHCRYEAVGTMRKSGVECEELLKDWHELRAKEAKYINSGNQKLYAEYKAMSREQKLAVLANLESHFYRTHLGDGYERNTTAPTYTRASAFERIGNNLRSSNANLAAAWGAIKNINCAARLVAERSALQTLAAVIDFHAGDRAQSSPPARGHARSVTEHASNGIIDFYRRKLDEQGILAKANTSSEFADIKQHLEAGRLLSYLSKSHGVIIEKYEITRGNDGSERIKCGNRSLNVSDFLTKEMNMPWKEAAPILREVYAAQRQNVLYQIKQQAPTRELWAKYQDWRKNEVPRAREEATYQIRANHDKAIAQVAKEFNAARSGIEGNYKLQRSEMKRQIDIEKAKREHAKKLARDSRNAAILAERTKWSTKDGNLYKRFLAEAAQTAETYAEVALAELRKLAPDVTNREDAVSYIKAVDQQAKEQGVPIRRDLYYSVNMQGHITYKIDGREALQDEGPRVNILCESDHDVIEQGLYLAKAKFGKTLTLHGSDQFKAEAVRVAVEKNIPVDFSDQSLQRLKLQLEQQKADRIAALRAQFEAHKQTEAGRQQVREAFEFKAEQARQVDVKEKADVKFQASMKTKAPPLAKETVPFAVSGSQPPYKQYGTYKGEVLAVDNAYVYQKIGKNVVHPTLS